MPLRLLTLCMYVCMYIVHNLARSHPPETRWWQFGIGIIPSTMVRMICLAYSSYSLRRVCLAFQEPVIRSQILEQNSATTQGTTEKSSHYFCLPMTHQQSTFSNPFVEAEEGCRKLARSSSSRETGQSSSALEVWYCYIVRHSVRLIGHLLLFC